MQLSAQAGITNVVFGGVGTTEGTEPTTDEGTADGGLESIEEVVETDEGAADMLAEAEDGAADGFAEGVAEEGAALAFPAASTEEHSAVVSPRTSI